MISHDATDPHARAIVDGDADGSAFEVHVGTANFALGGPDGSGVSMLGPNPYDLLGAALAACTATVLRLHARHKGYPLSHVEVAVNYLHTADGHGSFERTIVLEGDLDDEQRRQLLRGADSCPVGKVLGVGARIRDLPGGAPVAAAGTSTDYAQAVEDFSTVNIDPD